MSVPHDPAGQPDDRNHGMDRHPHQHFPSGDMALAMLSQLNRISVALGYVRMQLAGLDIPAEASDYLHDDRANILEMLNAAAMDLGGFKLNVHDALTGEATLGTPLRRRIALPAPQLVETLRDDLLDVHTDLTSLRARALADHHDDYMGVIEALESASMALSGLKEAIVADDGDDEEGGQHA